MLFPPGGRESRFCACFICLYAFMWAVFRTSVLKSDLQNVFSFWHITLHPNFFETLFVLLHYGWIRQINLIFIVFESGTICIIEAAGLNNPAIYYCEFVML